MAAREKRRAVRDDVKYHDVMLGLNKAQAAAELLDQLGSALPGAPLQEIDREGWLSSIAREALFDALEEAREAFVESQGPRPAIRDLKPVKKDGEEPA